MKLLIQSVDRNVEGFGSIKTTLNALCRDEKYNEYSLEIVGYNGSFPIPLEVVSDNFNHENELELELNISIVQKKPKVIKIK